MNRRRLVEVLSEAIAENVIDSPEALAEELADRINEEFSLFDEDEVDGDDED